MAPIKPVTVKNLKKEAGKELGNKWEEEKQPEEDPNQGESRVPGKEAHPFPETLTCDDTELTGGDLRTG